MRFVGSRHGVVQIARREPGAALAGAKLDVVRRVEALDLVAFEKRGFEHARRLGVIDVVDLREKLESSFGRRPAALEMARDAFLETRGLADVNDVAVSAQEPIHAGRVRERAASLGREGKRAPRGARHARRLGKPGCEVLPRLDPGLLEPGHEGAPDERGRLHVTGRAPEEVGRMTEKTRECANVAPR